MTGFRQRKPTPPSRQRSRQYGTAVGATVGALALMAVVNHSLARKAERDNPPLGRFVNVNGTRLHYLDRGQGHALVLLHGNGSMIQDFLSSGLINMAARRYRVIAFDRPGYGHSDRSAGRFVSAEAQADLIHAALRRIGIDHATVMGHSWGCSVAVALAQRHPEMVSGLVLASGYYYPTARVDAIGLSTPAIPIIGDIIRYTLAPILGRLIWPMLLRKIFGPAPVPAKFALFPKEMALRPSQLTASAAEAALLIPQAVGGRDGYGRLNLPVVIIAGDDDRLIDPRVHSARLHEDVPGSKFYRVPGVGHMIHQSATDAVMTAIDDAAGHSVS
ncbi:alpha/beta hydrolase [Fodinicurvata sp. EGI_FJ10296]|uniref:alpha/beta fold hydrolase n=1 Tax=Fodinicurvata sp. EGI_FJ10296 TaxID=3231908 RepID=UPI003453918D